MKKLDFYRNSIEKLEEIISAFEQELERPALKGGSFAYKSPTLKHICFLKAIRIISGLNALVVLLEAGYLTEMGVLLRTIGECVNDIYFLLEKFPDKTPEVEKYISIFLNKDADELQIVEDETKRIRRTKARTILASRVRVLAEHMNLLVDRDAVYKNYDTYSGYVHACYPNIMELYVGGSAGKFHLQGFKKSSRTRDWEKALVDFIRITILVFGYMAEQYDKPELIHKIRELMNWFEKQATQLIPTR